MFIFAKEIKKKNSIICFKLVIKLLKKNDKRFKHPDTRTWEVVAVKWCCEYNNENNV